MKFPTTPCIVTVTACTEPSHIILYAQQSLRLGHWSGQPLLFCLRHADDLLVLHRHADGRTAHSHAWLWSFLNNRAPWIDQQFGWDLTELPTVWAPHHARPERRHTPFPAKPKKIRSDVSERQPTRRYAR